EGGRRSQHDEPVRLTPGCGYNQYLGYHALSKVSRATGDDDDQRQQFLGDWRRVRVDELPQARGRLGPGAGSVQDPQGSRGCLARSLGREPPQGRRALLDRRRALARFGLRLDVKKKRPRTMAAPSGNGWGRWREGRPAALPLRATKRPKPLGTMTLCEEHGY